MNINEFKAEIVRNGLTIEEFADKANFKRTTLWRRLSRPDEFTLAEIILSAKALNLNNNRISEIFFADKVS